MPVVSNRWMLTLGGAAAYVAVALLFGPDAVAQKRGERPAEQPVAAQVAGGEKKLTPLFYGVLRCAGPGCHTTPPNAAAWPDQLLRCRNTEAELWNENDKHADAYHVINTEATEFVPDDKGNQVKNKHYPKAERARRMEKILAASKNNPNYKVTKDRDCLVCHSTYIADETLREKSRKEELFRVEEGVNCVTCHGAYLEWFVRHSNPATARAWRKLDRDQQQAEGGMVNLWDPVKRAELCASCHVGSMKSDPKNNVFPRFVTHEMYAAGHPPLPGFEAAMFSEEMPRHWQYLREKKPAVQKDLKYIDGEQEQTQLMLVGAVVALRESMRLLAKQAESAGADGLDYSNFDCYSCHHDLKKDAWRPKRYHGKPGRVPMREWPTELVQLAIAQAYPDAAARKQAMAEFEAARKKVRDAFLEQPFGNPKSIKTAAAAMAGWADKLATRLQYTDADKKTRRVIKADEVEKLLKQVPAMFGGKELDFDSARQVGWAFDVLYNELHGYPYKRKGIDEAKPQREADPKVRAAQKNLETYLRLRLPQGRKQIIEDELAENLKALNAYRPERFQGLMKSLKAALGE